MPYTSRSSRPRKSPAQMLAERVQRIEGDMKKRNHRLSPETQAWAKSQIAVAKTSIRRQDYSGAMRILTAVDQRIR